MKTSLLTIVMACLLLASCGEDPTPRPRGQLRLDLPKKAYVEHGSGCPYRLHVPEMTEVQIPPKGEGRCWKNIHYPSMDATIYLTYTPIEDNLARLLKDSRDLTYEHHIKATDIRSEQIRRPESKVYGLLYEVSGDVASNTQFYLTDSTSHFIRGALYFDTRPNWDSLAPAVAYINQDIRHMIQEMEWR